MEGKITKKAKVTDVVYSIVKYNTETNQYVGERMSTVLLGNIKKEKVRQALSECLEEGDFLLLVSTDFAERFYTMGMTYFVNHADVVEIGEKPVDTDDSEEEPEATVDDSEKDSENPE